MTEVNSVRCDKMLKIRRFFYVILFVIIIKENNAEFLSTFNQLNIKNIINVIDASVFHNWTGNHDCFNELNTIKNGLINFENWAIKRK